MSRRAASFGGYAHGAMRVGASAVQRPMLRWARQRDNWRRFLRWHPTSGDCGNKRSTILRRQCPGVASDIAVDIEIGARNHGAAFRSHIDILRAASDAARRAKRPLKIPVTLDGQRTCVEPDALFSVGNHVYALEADKGTESIRAVIVPKILAYREIVADHLIDDWLGVDNLTVLFATPSEVRMRNVMLELKQIARNGRSSMFGFRADPAFAEFMQTMPPSGRLATAPWARVGFEDLFLVDRKQDS